VAEAAGLEAADSAAVVGAVEEEGFAGAAVEAESGCDWGALAQAASSAARTRE
jgi:hypothetical protein